MGKTEAGALWLSPEKTSPYRFYQYWINLDDADVGKCLRYFTDLDQEEIRQVEAEHLSDPGRRTAQRRLAAELTRLVHGDEGLAVAQRATEIFFGAEIGRTSDAQLAGIFADVPSKKLPRRRLDGDGLPIAEALFEAGLAKSKSEARRIVSPRRRLRQQPPRRRPRHPPRGGRPGRRIDPGAPRGQEELRPVAVRRLTPWRRGGRR